MMYYKICPRCGSIDIVPSMTTGILPESNYCNDCNFRAGIFPEVKKSEIEYFRKKIKASSGI